MNKKGITFAAFLFLSLSCFSTNGFAAGLPGVSRDNGTDEEGTLIVPKAMALRCDFKSKDGGDANKITECLDKIASDMYGPQAHKPDVIQTRNDILQGFAKGYMDLANKYKASAGDYVDKGDENGNSDLKTDKHGKKEQEGKVSGSNAKSVMALTDVLASSMTLDSMEVYFENLKSREISDEMKENGQEAPAEETTGGGNE